MIPALTAFVPTALPSAFEAVKVDYWAVLPILLVIGGALVSVLVEAFAPRGSRHAMQVVLTLVTILAALVALVVWSVDHKGKTLGGSIVVDGPTLFLQGSVLVMSLLVILKTLLIFLITCKVPMVPMLRSLFCMGLLIMVEMKMIIGQLMKPSCLTKARAGKWIMNKALQLSQSSQGSTCNPSVLVLQIMIQPWIIN